MTGAQVAPERRVGTEATLAALAHRGAWEHKGGRSDQQLVLVEGPALVEQLTGALPQPLLEGRFEALGAQGKLAAHIVEQGFCHGGAGFRTGRAEGWMGGPERLVCGHLIERVVGEHKQAALLKIWLHQAPATAQILVDAILDHVLERGAHALGVRPDHTLTRDSVVGESKLMHRLARDPRVVEPCGCGCNRTIDRGAQQGSAYEVVEVTGLERGILAVIGEAEQLARIVLQCGVGAHLRDRRDG